MLMSFQIVAVQQNIKPAVGTRQALDARGCFSLSTIKRDLLIPFVKFICFSIYWIRFPHLLHILYQIIRMYVLKRTVVLLLDIKNHVKILLCMPIVEIPGSFQ